MAYALYLKSNATDEPVAKVTSITQNKGSGFLGDFGISIHSGTTTPVLWSSCRQEEGQSGFKGLYAHQVDSQGKPTGDACLLVNKLLLSSERGCLTMVLENESQIGFGFTINNRTTEGYEFDRKAKDCCILL